MLTHDYPATELFPNYIPQVDSDDTISRDLAIINGNDQGVEINVGPMVRMCMHSD